MKIPIDKAVERIDKLVKGGQLKQAGILATRLILEHSSEPRAWRERAFVKRLQDRHGEAIADMTKAIALNEFRLLDDMFTRGVSWFKMRRYKDAVDDFTRTIELSVFFKTESHRIQAYFFRADCYISLNKFIEAQADCEHVPEEFKTWTDKLKSKKDILAACSKALARRHKKGAS